MPVDEGGSNSGSTAAQAQSADLNSQRKAARLVSVVIAVRNEEQHVREAVSSITSQALVEFEVIVVDDNSTDGTWRILNEIAQGDARVKLIQNPRKGKNSAFNLGVSLAKGDYVCLFAGDDIMPQGALSGRVNAISNTDPAEPVVGLCKLQSFSEDKRFDGHVVPKGEGRGGFTGVSYLMSRAAVSRIFPVPEALPNEDTWMELAVTNLPGLIHVHCGVVGCMWRVHGGNSINMQLDFHSYNEKYTQRMKAISLFFDRHGAELEASKRRELARRVACEEARASGSVVGVMFSKARFVERLRALSTTNRFMYDMRRRLFGLLSGF